MRLPCQCHDSLQWWIPCDLEVTWKQNSMLLPNIYKYEYQYAKFLYFLVIQTHINEHQAQHNMNVKWISLVSWKMLATWASLTVILSSSMLQYSRAAKAVIGWTQWRLCPGTNLKVRGTGPEQNWGGAPIWHFVLAKNFFWSCPSTFLALKVQLFVLVSTFVMVSTVWSVYCLLFFYSRCPRASPL